MEGSSQSSNTGNSYTERAIYEEIIANLANLGSFAADETELPSSQNDIAEKPYNMWSEAQDPRLSSVLNDHDYILPARRPRLSLTVRQNLIEFVEKNSSPTAMVSSSSGSLEKLVDVALEMLSKVTDYDAMIEVMEKACLSMQEVCPKIEQAQDQVLEDDCKNEPFDKELLPELKDLLNSLMESVDDSPKTESDLQSDEKPPLELVNQPATVLKEPVKAENPQDSKEVEKMDIADLAKPLDNMDVPLLEAKQLKDDVDIADEKSAPTGDQATHPKSDESTSLESMLEDVQLPEVIKELLVFADKLKTDCTGISNKNDFNLDSFLVSKLNEYKSIIKLPLCVDSSMQTEKVISKKKLRKINAQDKRLLLESSNDSESSTSSFVDKNMGESEGEYDPRKPFFSEFSTNYSNGKDCLGITKSPEFFQSDSDSENDGGKSDSSDSEDSTSSKNDKDNSDQVSSGSSADKVKSDAGEKLGEGKGTNESDKENRSFATSPESKSKQDDKAMDEGSQEKEIERLLNLKGLTDPQKNASLTNNTKSNKSSSKFSKKDSLYAVMQELDKNSLSDDSGNEDSEQILTEKQFLVKCNENLKQQLLASASSDSETFNSDPDIDLIAKTNAPSDDEDDVDKFLETLADTEDNKTAADDAPPKSTSPTSPTKLEDTTKEILNQAEEKADKSKSSTLTDSFGFKKKEISQKSFETILSNEKQQKAKLHDELIDLSAESCSSDIEDYPTESKEKSQRIKPMLRQDQLESETIHAQKKEAERLRRLEKRNNHLTKMLKLHSDSVSEKDLVLDYATANKKFIKVHPEIVKHLKPHQRDGVKFMYDSCYGCVDRLKDTSGSGCILAHCMGLGKTLQIIALLHTVTTYKELKTSKILVLCPKSTIMNWADEIQRWLGPLDIKNLQIFNFSDTADIYEKINVLRQWSVCTTKAGCLIMGYEAFRSLVFYHSNKGRSKSAVKIEDIRKSINKYLLKPGADLVVCDEGHIIKNRKSGISLAAAEIVTPKRIILTGTPIQNNLKEYYSMVNFIKPLILGTEKEFANLYANPIKNGQHKDSSKRDIKVMKQRSFVLHKKLSKFVQRKEAELLQSFLPQKFEYVLFIPMTDVQNNLYEYVLDAISKREDSKGRSLITDYTCLRKIWTHPKVLEDAWKNAITAKNKKEPRKSNSLGHGSDDDQPDDIYDSQTGVISVQRDWWRSLVTETDLESILPSNKLKTMFEIIRMSEENGEKCLIFSAFVAVLNVVEYFFNKINDGQRNYFLIKGQKTTVRWVNGEDYYRLDGKTNKTLRHEMVKRFNDPKNKRARVFLISARAGGQGINLIGANRVIILDTSWNPANDQQNIFRIFRLGQKKNCYVYRLIAMGTMEEKVYSRSVTKQAMSFRVVDEQQIDRHYSMAELAELYTLTKPIYSERPVPVFPQDQILANLLLNFPDLVYKYHEHDSLLENKVEQELSEQEKADAWVAYERDLQMNSEPREVVEGYHGPTVFNPASYMYSMGAFEPKGYPPAGSEMDFMARNALGTSLLPNYLVNSNSYLDILNMYKKFSSTILNEKTNRNPRFNSSNYAMSLGMLNNAAMCGLPTGDSHLTTVPNPFYPLHTLANAGKNPFASNPLRSNPMMPTPGLPNTSQPGPDRYDRGSGLMSPEEIASTLCNYPAPLPPFAKDLSTRSLQPKSLLQNSPVLPPSSSSPILHSPTRQRSQNMFNPMKDPIGRKPRTKPPNKSPLLHNLPGSESATAKVKNSESLLRSSSPGQGMSSIQDPAMKIYDLTGPGTLPPVPPGNMGIVYPKHMPTALSPALTDSNDGSSHLLKSSGSMQIIPTHSQLTESVRKKFDNISPNISLTAVRTMPKPMQSEPLQPASSSGHMEITRKRRNSLSNSGPPGSDREQMFSSGNNRIGSTPSAIEQPSYPPKVSKL